MTEARELAKAAGLKQRKAESKVKSLEENGVLQSEIKRVREGHAEAHKADQVVPSSLVFMSVKVRASAKSCTHVSTPIPTTMPPRNYIQTAESKLGDVEERAMLNEERWKDAERRLKEKV